MRAVVLGIGNIIRSGEKVGVRAVEAFFPGRERMAHAPVHIDAQRRQEERGDA